MDCEIKTFAADIKTLHSYAIESEYNSPKKKSIKLIKKEQKKQLKKVRNIDILVFGDANAGKKSFVEQFMNRAVGKNTQMKHSWTQQCAYLSKMIDMPD